MSGIFLVVSNFDKPDTQELLRSTNGGYPHITLCYTGDNVATEALVPAASQAIQDLQTNNEFPYRLILDSHDVTVNSFYEEKTGEMRHDVLMTLSVGDAAVINNLRGHCSAFEKDATFRTPHITHAILYDKDVADTTAEHLRQKLPIDAYITGFVLD